jgi:hypothetical protein
MMSVWNWRFKVQPDLEEIGDAMSLSFKVDKANTVSADGSVRPRSVLCHMRRASRKPLSTMGISKRLSAMENKGAFTKILAIAGAILAWLPLNALAIGLF